MDEKCDIDAIDGSVIYTCVLAQDDDDPALVHSARDFDPAALSVMLDNRAKKRTLLYNNPCDPMRKARSCNAEPKTAVQIARRIANHIEEDAIRRLALSTRESVALDARLDHICRIGDDPGTVRRFLSQVRQPVKGGSRDASRESADEGCKQCRRPKGQFYRIPLGDRSSHGIVRSCARSVWLTPLKRVCICTEIPC